jgi:hypothetical protein
MAFGLVTQAQAQGITNPTTSSLNTTGADLLVVSVHEYDGGPAGTVSDSKSNSWTALTSYNSSGASKVRIYYATSAPTVGSGHTFQYTGSGVYATISVEAWSGAHPTTPFDVENGNIGAVVSSLQPGSVTPSVNGSLLYTARAAGGASDTISIDSGFTIGGTVDYNAGSGELGGSHAYLVQTTAAAINPTWSSTSAATTQVAIAVFKPAAGDTTPPTLSSRTVPTGGVTLTATLSESGCTPSSGTGGFTLAGTVAAVTSWAISGTTLTLQLSARVYSWDTITLSYARASTTDDIEDAAGNFLADFSNASVTNSSTQTTPLPSGGFALIGDAGPVF